MIVSPSADLSTRQTCVHMSPAATANLCLIRGSEHIYCGLDGLINSDAAANLGELASVAVVNGCHCEYQKMSCQLRLCL